MNRKITHEKKANIHMHCTHDMATHDGDNFIAFSLLLGRNYSLNIEIRLCVCNAVHELCMCIIVKWKKA